MKYFIIPLVTFSFFSCNESKKVTELSEAEEVSKIHTDQMSARIENLETIIPNNVDDKFETFLKYFNKDSTFQISRIDFPLKYKVADSDENYELVEEVIEKSEFRKMDLSYDSTSTTREFDKYEHSIHENGNKATIELRGIDNGIMVDFFFEKKNGKWKLLSWVDAST